MTAKLTFRLHNHLIGSRIICHEMIFLKWLGFEFCFNFSPENQLMLLFLDVWTLSNMRTSETSSPLKAEYLQGSFGTGCDPQAQSFFEGVHQISYCTELTTGLGSTGFVRIMSISEEVCLIRNLNDTMVHKCSSLCGSLLCEAMSKPLPNGLICFTTVEGNSSSLNFK